MTVDLSRVAAMEAAARAVGLRAVRCSWAGRGQWRIEMSDGSLVAGEGSLHDCERWLDGCRVGLMLALWRAASAAADDSGNIPSQN